MKELVMISEGESRHIGVFETLLECAGLLRLDDKMYNQGAVIDPLHGHGELSPYTDAGDFRALASELLKPGLATMRLEGQLQYLAAFPFQVLPSGASVSLRVLSDYVSLIDIPDYKLEVVDHSHSEEVTVFRASSELWGLGALSYERHLVAPLLRKKVRGRFMFNQVSGSPNPDYVEELLAAL